MAEHPLAKLAGALGVVASAGCATISAPVDRGVKQGGFAARVEAAAVRPNRETRIAVVVETMPTGVKLLEASLSASSREPCGGTPATGFARSAAASPDEPLRPDERIVLEFPDSVSSQLSEPGPRLDLLLESPRGTRRCLPVPLVDGARKLDWQVDQRFTAGLDFSLEGYTDRVGSITQIVAFTVTFGVWLDRYRLEAGVGVGGAACPEDTCPVEDENSDYRVDYSTVVPFHAGAQTPLLEAGEVSFGVGLRYRAVKLVADTYESHEAYWAHGPVIAPYIGAILPGVEKGWGGSRRALIGAEIPVGYVIAANGERAVSIGFNLRSFVTAF